MVVSHALACGASLSARTASAASIPMAATPLAMIATARGDLLRPAALTTRSSQRKLPGASAQVTGPAAGRCAAAYLIE